MTYNGDIKWFKGSTMMVLKQFKKGNDNTKRVP